VIVTTGVGDTDTEWHFTQERRIGASHARSPKIIADEKHKFVSSGDELIALQQPRVRTSVSIWFNCLEQVPHAHPSSTYGRIQHMSAETAHAFPPYRFW
jgi:hypothetical protein